MLGFLLSKEFQRSVAALSSDLASSSVRVTSGPSNLEMLVFGSAVQANDFPSTSTRATAGWSPTVLRFSVLDSRLLKEIAESVSVYEPAILPAERWVNWRLLSTWVVLSCNWLRTPLSWASVFSVRPPKTTKATSESITEATMIQTLTFA